jgi:outer membrane protein
MKMKIVYVLIAICFICILGLISYVCLYTNKEKTAYFYNQQVFQSFNGTRELEAKLAHQQQRAKKELDSISHLIHQGRTDLAEQYQKIAATQSQQYQLLSEQYTNDIWKFINENVKEYGNQEGYDYIFGASGNGSLMYAKDSHNITDDIISFVNEKYDSK